MTPPPPTPTNPELNRPPTPFEALEIIAALVERATWKEASLQLFNTLSTCFSVVRAAVTPPDGAPAKGKGKVDKSAKPGTPPPNMP